MGSDQLFAVTAELTIGVGVIFTPLKHIKPADHCALPLLVFLTMLNWVRVVVSKNAQIPPQISAPDRTVEGVLDTLNNLAVGAAVIIVLATFCEDKIL